MKTKFITASALAIALGLVVCWLEEAHNGSGAGFLAGFLLFNYFLDALNANKR